MAPPQPQQGHGQPTGPGAAGMDPTLPSISALSPPGDAARPATALWLKPPISDLEIQAIILHRGNPKLMRKKPYNLLFPVPLQTPDLCVPTLLSPFPRTSAVPAGPRARCTAGCPATGHGLSASQRRHPQAAALRHGQPSTAPFCPLLINTLVSPITVFFQVFFLLAPSNAFSPCGTTPELQLWKVLTRCRTASLSFFPKSRTLRYGNGSGLCF